jgi:hypothetical protein
LKQPVAFYHTDADKTIILSNSKCPPEQNTGIDHIVNRGVFSTVQRTAFGCTKTNGTLLSQSAEAAAKRM